MSSKIPYTGPQVHMLELGRTSIRDRVARMIQVTQEAAAECQRSLDPAQPVDDMLTSVMSKLRNSHNTVMGDMESAIRSLGEMLTVTDIAAKEQMERADAKPKPNDGNCEECGTTIMDGEKVWTTGTGLLCEVCGNQRDWDE
jgi:hypothetical protein